MFKITIERWRGRKFIYFCERSTAKPKNNCNIHTNVCVRAKWPRKRISNRNVIENHSQWINAFRWTNLIFSSSSSSNSTSDDRERVTLTFHRRWMVWMCVCNKFNGINQRKMKQTNYNSGISIIFSMAWLVRLSCQRLVAPDYIPGTKRRAKKKSTIHNFIKQCDVDFE